MKHIIKKRRKRRALLFLFIIALTVTAAFYFKNKNVSYIAQDVYCHIGNSVNLKPEKFEKVTTYTIDELKNKENVVIINSLILVNKENHLPENFEADTKYLKERNVYLDKYAAEHFNELESDVQSIFNDTLFISSAYRTEEEQERIFKEYGNKTAQIPGASEHQSGLAADVFVSGFSGASFIKSEIGEYVNSNCGKYGFIIRYNYFGKSKTGIDYEPWHIRYVGFPHADIINRNRVTLEEYIENFEIGSFYEYDGYVITRQPAEENISLPEHFKSAVISPDNTGNYIITLVLSTSI